MSSRIKAGIGLALSLAAAAAAAPVKPGDAFPPLAAADLEGTLPSTAGRVVLVDFWASWCAPCQVSFPAYARLQADYAARGLVIIAVSVDQQPAAFAAFVRKFHPPFPAVRDRIQSLVRTVDVPTLPASYLIGRDGNVRFVHAGFFAGRTERELRQEIDLLLSREAP